MEYSIETYDLLLVDGADKTCNTVLSPTNGLAFKRERRKLYLIFHDNQILYVGEANTSIKTRL